MQTDRQRYNGIVSELSKKNKRKDEPRFRYVPIELFPTHSRAKIRDKIVQEQANGLFLAWQHVGDLLKGAMNGENVQTK